MAGKSDAAENDLLLLLFNNTDWADVGDAAGLQASAADGSFFAALHTADPTDSGLQNASEVAYTGYARVAVARTTGGWTISSSSVSPASDIDFPEKTGGADQTATFFSIGLESTGATDILYFGALSASILIQNNDIPRLTTATAITED